MYTVFAVYKNRMVILHEIPKIVYSKGVYKNRRLTWKYKIHYPHPVFEKYPLCMKGGKDSQLILNKNKVTCKHCIRMKKIKKEY